MGRQLAKGIVTLGMWLCFSSAAFAQLKDNIEINVFGGGGWYSSKDFEIGFPQSATPITGKFKLDPAWRGGVRLGVFTRGHWSQEFFYSYERNNAQFNRLTPPTSSLDLPIQVHNYGVTALYYLDENESNAVRPFLSIGVGGTVYRLSREAKFIATNPLEANIPDVNNSSELTMNYGFGLKTRTSGWLGFRADVRGYLGRPPSFGLARQSNDPNATVFPITGAMNNAEVSAGLVFYFFGRR
jgi:hypothetical protein